MVGDCYRLGEIEQVNEKDKLAWERACDALYGFGYSEQFSMALWQAALEYARQPAQAEPVVLSDEWTPCMKLPVVVHVRKQREGELHVSTREGITPVNPDDLIMRGVSGEEYPIGRDIFEQTYSAQVCTHPAPAVAQDPVFWYRPASDGSYYGPIHHSAIEDVRKISGAWVPLVHAALAHRDEQPAVAVNEQLLGALKVIVDARESWIDAKLQAEAAINMMLETIPPYREDGASTIPDKTIEFVKDALSQAEKENAQDEADKGSV